MKFAKNWITLVRVVRVYCLECKKGRQTKRGHHHLFTLEKPDKYKNPDKYKKIIMTTKCSLCLSLSKQQKRNIC